MDSTIIPIPRDIPLPLPANPLFLQVLLVVAFVAHILFVNLMVGGALLVLFYQLRGLRQPVYDKLAHAIAVTITVNKSMAVVLGVAPLLLINVLYTMHFYTANALTGTAWILVIPSVAITFLLLYLHKFNWDRMARARGMHIAILGLAVLLLMFIPLIFLANINLMLFPERWSSIRGLFSALILPSVLPRYFHFMCASVILTSLFCVHHFGRARYPLEELIGGGLTRPQLRREFYSIAFVFSLAQFFVGPLVLFTLPTVGKNGIMVLVILLGALNAIPAVWLMWKELTLPEPHGRYLLPIVLILGGTVLAMATGRHMYRELALNDHRADMAVATARWQTASAQAAYDLKMGRVKSRGATTPGQELFEANCSACHALDTKMIGPPILEIATLYKGNAAGIVKWAVAPGKKRPDFPQMPPFAQLSDDKLQQIASHMLKIASGK